MHTLLQVSDDDHLVVSRGLVLQQTGLEVVSTRPAQVEHFLDSYFDIVLLCHTVEHVDAERISRQIHLFWPLTRLVRIAAEAALHVLSCRSVAYFLRDRGPGALLHLIASLLPAPLQALRVHTSVTVIHSLPHGGGNGVCRPTALRRPAAMAARITILP